MLFEICHFASYLFQLAEEWAYYSVNCVNGIFRLHLCLVNVILSIKYGGSNQSSMIYGQLKIRNNTNYILMMNCKIEEECVDAIETCVISHETKLLYMRGVDEAHWFPM